MPPLPPSVSTVVVVDDAPEVRTLVRTRLRVSGRFQVVGEGGDGEAAVDLARRLRPTILLLDVSMPGTDGLQALPRVLEASPGTRVVMFSGFEEHGLVDRALVLGAAAFVEKSTPVDLLIERLLLVAGEAAGADRGGDGSVEVRTDRLVDRGVLDEHLERFREVFDQAAIGMATMTLTGTIVRVNRALAALLGVGERELVGRDYATLATGRGDEVTAALTRFETEPLELTQVEHGIAGPAERRLLATLAPVRDSAGRPLYVFLQVQDVTAERAALEELRRASSGSGSWSEPCADYAIFMLDPDGRVASWNAGAQRIKGYTADEIIGQHFRIFYPRGAAGRAATRSTSSSSRCRDGPVRGGGVADPQGRHPVLGQRGDHRRSATTTAGTSGSPRSPATSPSGARPRRAAAERAAVPAAGRGGRGLRDLHARPRRPDRELERRRAAQQGLHRRRDHRPALPRLLPARRRPRATPSTSSTALRDGHYEEEGWRIRKDGTRFWATSSSPRCSTTTATHVGFAKVTRDNTERRRLEQEREGALIAVAAANTELEELNERLRAAAEDQAKFLAVTAHELRTPVGVLGGSAEMLSQHWDGLADAEREELLEAMSSSTVPAPAAAGRPAHRLAAPGERPGDGQRPCRGERAAGRRRRQRAADPAGFGGDGGGGRGARGPRGPRPARAGCSTTWSATPCDTVCRRCGWSRPGPATPSSSGSPTRAAGCPPRSGRGSSRGSPPAPRRAPGSGSTSSGRSLAPTAARPTTRAPLPARAGPS